MSFQDFTKLDVWVSARQLTNLIYSLTKEFPNSEQFGLTIQMRRCAISVPSNIAEGCGRNTSKGKLVFFLYFERLVIRVRDTTLYQFRPKFY